MIEHSNIFYVRDIHKIGGVETYVYEMAKKYKDYDIAVVTKNIAYEQLQRLLKYCKVYIHKDQKIKCKVIITNWDTSIFDYVNEDAKKYTVLHTDYSNKIEKPGIPKDRPDITYIGITEYNKKVFEEITGITRTILCRNPYELEEDRPILTLLSATRLTEIKDGGRMLYLANTLQKLGINYILYIMTTDEYPTNPIWKNKNIVHVPNRLDVGSLMKKADWYIQLSICEGDSYSLKEALYRGIPIVVCELPYFKEIGIKDRENALYYKSDNSNAEEIAKAMLKPLKFKFNKVIDGYDEIIIKDKSNYEEGNMKAKLKVITGYTDIQLNESLPVGHEFIVDRKRAEELLSNPNHLVEFVEYVEEEPKKEKAVKPKKKVEKR